MMKKFGKIFAWVLTIVIALILINDACDSKTYYYAHSKYTDKRKLPAPVVDNLTDFVSQYNKDDFENISFTLKTINFINYSGYLNEDVSITFSSKSGDNTYLVRKTSKDFETTSYYTFDSMFKYIGGYIEHFDGHTTTPSYEDSVKLENQLIIISDKIIENYEPLINCQWFYDVLFTDRTVDKYD